MSVAVKRALAVVSYLILAPAVGAGADARERADLSAIAINDNSQPAGVWHDGVLTLSLRAAVGAWRPEGLDGPALRVEALGEATGSLQVPAPLIRVREGTTVAASVQNELDVPLRVHGLCTRGGDACAPLDVPAGSRRDVRFESGPAGTYHYWATSTGMPLRFRGASDTQMSGAFIVDPADRAAERDRVLVITEWTSLTRDELATLAAADDPGALFLQMKPRFTFLINGRSWPSTERLAYRVGERVRWRVVNLSTQPHPMHLHGFYFDVDSRGDGLRDAPVAADRRPSVVTEVMAAGATLLMTWTPEREGNWLFHCHIAQHVSPDRRLGTGPSPAHAHHASDDASAGMAGMVLGVTVSGAVEDSTNGTGADVAAARQLTLVLQADPNRYGADPAYGFVLAEGDHPSPFSRVSVPGPLLVLERGKPVEITLENRLPEATAIHWHGIELESFYDGVHGWSGSGARVTPLIEPGRSFTVRFTPPRAGTFMYHTHMHDERQLASGLYGALLVLEPGDRFDPDVDHIMVISRGGPGEDAPIVLNGTREPRLTFKSGATHRLRFVNITPDDIVSVSLASAAGPASWRPLAKDAAPLPAGDQAPVPARQTMAVGETFDFAYTAPPGRAGLWMELRSPAGRWHTQGRVTVK